MEIMDKLHTDVADICLQGNCTYKDLGVEGSVIGEPCYSVTLVNYYFDRVAARDLEAFFQDRGLFVYNWHPTGPYNMELRVYFTSE